MKAKLIKKEDDFYSLRVDGIVMATSNGMLVDYKLSKQNCDELFGVIDVEKFSHEHCDRLYHEGDINWERYRIHFKLGFNKAMELNKDKLFTVEDIMKAFEAGYETLESEKTYNEHYDILIQSLQQPTEIEVEIEQVLIQSSIDGEAIWKYRLDEKGCLILRRI